MSSTLPIEKLRKQRYRARLTDAQKQLLREENTAQRKRKRELQIEEERQKSREENTAQRKKQRQLQIEEERQKSREDDTAQRKRQRQLQTEEERQKSREENTAQRKKQRQLQIEEERQKSQKKRQRARQHNMYCTVLARYKQMLADREHVNQERQWHVGLVGNEKLGIHKSRDPRKQYWLHVLQISSYCDCCNSRRLMSSLFAMPSSHKLDCYHGLKFIAGKTYFLCRACQLF